MGRLSVGGMVCVDRVKRKCGRVSNALTMGDVMSVLASEA